LAEQALREIRRASTDAHERLAVLQLATSALLRPELVHRRLALYDETLELAAPPARTPRRRRRSARAPATGPRSAARPGAVRRPAVPELAQRHHVPQNLVVTAGSRARCCRWRAAWRRRSRRSPTSGPGGDARDGRRGIDLAQLANVRDLQGRLAELEPALAAAAGYHPAFVELHALSMVACGRQDQLRLRLGSYAEQAPIHRDYMWMGLMCIRARYWAALEDQEAVADLRAQLEPYADLLAGTIAVTFQGCVHHTLGLLSWWPTTARPPPITCARHGRRTSGSASTCGSPAPTSSWLGSDYGVAVP
jgi:hypothetical protein